MKIELKNIQYSEALSEETNAFAANLYIEGKKAGTASNRGHGGSTDYQAVDENGKKLIAKAETYCKSLPSEKFKSGGKDYMFEMNLENYIDKLLDKYLQAKDLKRFQKRIEKEMERGIVVGIPDKSYSVWRFKMPLANYLKNASGLQIIKMALINEIIPSLTKDKIIMNTNIPEKLLKEAGLKENHYAKIVYKDSSQRADNKKTQRKL
ncbi:hypothetical protein [Chryseobacterium sp. ERMR1:04]|uniref:hypothetical protein n=1 Tax=Chryseobacterium sp. ERMR1:04 TaxID=1705393 RepID=UPI0006C8A578|nr:hypothetical protein [Chryseobacterium sp. ERMR1:04]KPH13332.1 hypothetical protein AMQ68_12815 [Chryseobacterium sp. ERMR1:04]